MLFIYYHCKCKNNIPVRLDLNWHSHSILTIHKPLTFSQMKCTLYNLVLVELLKAGCFLISVFHKHWWIVWLKKTLNIGFINVLYKVVYKVLSMEVETNSKHVRSTRRFLSASMLLVRGDCAGGLYCKFRAFIPQVLKFDSQKLPIWLECRVTDLCEVHISKHIWICSHDDMQLHVLREGKLHLLVIFHPVILSTFPKPHQWQRKKNMDLMQLSIVLDNLTSDYCH